MAPNEGFAAGIGTRSAKERLAWALKGAPLRKKDLLLGPVGAVAEGRKLRDSITTKMRLCSIDPEEAAVFIVFATSDFSALSHSSAQTWLPVVPDHNAEIVMAAKNGRNVPIGFVVLVSDEDKGIFGHVRPLLVDERSLKLNEQALSVFMRIAASKFFPDRSN